MSSFLNTVISMMGSEGVGNKYQSKGRMHLVAE
jgi:hypothetical protein